MSKRQHTVSPVQLWQRCGERMLRPIKRAKQFNNLLEFSFRPLSFEDNVAPFDVAGLAQPTSPYRRTTRQDAEVSYRSSPLLRMLRASYVSSAGKSCGFTCATMIAGALAAFAAASAASSDAALLTVCANCKPSPFANLTKSH